MQFLPGHGLDPGVRSLDHHDPWARGPHPFDPSLNPPHPGLMTGAGYPATSPSLTPSWQGTISPDSTNQVTNVNV